MTTAPSYVSIVEHKGVRQFVKFVIVGASSATINFAVTNVLHFVLHVRLVPNAVTAAFLISVVNGFYWNRRWTFKEARGNSAHSQGVRFLLVNVVGLILTNTIVLSIVALKSGSVHSLADFQQLAMNVVSSQAKETYGPLLVNGALGCATVVVAFWNFFANRFWTFRH